MKQVVKITVFASLLFVLASFAGSGTKKVKCMIQMANYEGEGAYVVISLINPTGKYEKTLYVQGDDKEWYYELTSWWKFYGKNKTKLDGITGSTVSGGQRSIQVIQLDPSKINKGYKLRFESAVEAKNYYQKDIEISLTSDNLAKKFNGKGFIRYIRMLPQ